MAVMVLHKIVPVNEVLAQYFVETQGIKLILESLIVWGKCVFINITKIDNKEECLQKLSEFERDVKKFYDVGRNIS